MRVCVWYVIIFKETGAEHQHGEQILAQIEELNYQKKEW